MTLMLFLLAAIFSWLTPYPVWLDLGLIIGMTTVAAILEG